MSGSNKLSHHQLWRIKIIVKKTKNISFLELLLFFYHLDESRMRIPVYVLGFQSFPRISFAQASCYNTIQLAAMDKRQLCEERFRNVPRECEHSGRVRGNLRWDSAASSGMMSPFSTGGGTKRRNEGPRSLARSFSVIVRVFWGRRGLARDIGSRGTDNLVLTDRWTTLIQDPGPAHLIDTDKLIILFWICPRLRITNDLRLDISTRSFNVDSRHKGLILIFYIVS